MVRSPVVCVHIGVLSVLLLSLCFMAQGSCLFTVPSVHQSSAGGLLQGRKKGPFVAFLKNMLNNNIIYYIVIYRMLL